MDPELYYLVIKHQVHVPCIGVDDNTTFIVNVRCSKDYPMYYKTYTSTPNNSEERFITGEGPREGGRTSMRPNILITNCDMVTNDILL